MAQRKSTVEEKETKWKTERIFCEGETPIILNNPATRDDLRFNELDDKGVAELRLYKNGDGEFGIPRENFFACLVNAGTMMSINFNGRSTKITVGGRTKSKDRKRNSLIPGLLKIKEKFLSFTPDEWVVDKRDTINPSTGGRNLTVRPRFDKWGFWCTIEFDESLLSEEKLRKLVELGGRWFGLGCDRAEVGGPFGQFKIANGK